MSQAHPQFFHSDHGEDEEFALSSQQLLSARDPGAPMSVVVAEQSERFVGRPYRVWRDDPELARRINDRLAGAARTVQIG